jgi:hypothetical protein
MSLGYGSIDPTIWLQISLSDAARSAIHLDLSKQAKLMYEMGITSPDVDLDTIHEEYFSDPQNEMACGVSGQAAVSSTCLPWGTAHGLDGALALCQRMLSSHVATQVFDQELSGCLDLLARPELAETGSCPDEYRTVVESLEERLLQKSSSRVITSAGGTIGGLAAALGQIDRWHIGAAKSFVANKTSLTAATSRVLSTFWNRVYAAGSPIPEFALGEAGSTVAKGQLASLLSARLEVDRQVLAAAFANPAPLDEAPLLLLTSDALTEIGDRLSTAAPLYDFACRIRGGCSVGEANEATQLIRLIGAIGDDAQLGAALSGGTGVRGPWLELFTAIRARRGALEAALRKATGRPDASLTELYLPSPPASATALGGRVAEFRSMWTSYAAHGVLRPHDATLLRTSLVDSKVVSTLQSFVDSRNTLQTQRENFQRSRGDFARSVVDRIANQQFQVRVANDLTAARVEYDNLAQDLDGLMHSQDRAEHQIGAFLETYVQRASAPGWLPAYPVAGHPGFLSISAAAARGDGRATKDVTAVAVRDPAAPSDPWHLDVAKGDMLTFDIANLWSPTCALRAMTLTGPENTTIFMSPTDVLVGPEGFSLTFQTDKFAASDHTSTDFESETNSSSVCGSISAGLHAGGDDSLGFGSLSATGQACRQWQTGHSETDSTSDGDRFQSSAAFSGGLRVDRTPFPSLPGGALLLIEVVDKPGGGTMVRDTHVVHAHASFVFPQSARLYLAVNDRSGCNVNTSALSVNYVHAQSIAAASHKLAEGMATILASLQTQKSTYIAQGSVTSSELSALQSGAYDQLRAACDCNLGAFPEEVRGMFDAWLGTELASIEREVRIVAAERTLDSFVLRVSALNADLASAQSAARLLSLLTYWQLAHLAYPQLRIYTEAVLQGANENMLPIMRVLYPQAIAAVRSTGALPIENLRTFDWTLPYDEQIAPLETISDIIKQKVDNARNAGGQSIAPLVLVFPKPGTTAPSVPGSIVVPPERLAAVWGPCASGTGTCLRQRPTFTITPEDAYGHPLVGVGCGEAAPVAQSFALLTMNNGSSGNDSWNTNPRRADISRGPDMVFPTEAGVLGFRTDGVTGVLAPSRVRVLASTISNVGSTFDDFVRRPGSDLQGVSPFGSFTVDLGPEVNTAAPLTGSTAMIAYFDLQARTATGPLVGVAACSQSLSTPPPAGPEVSQ